MQQANGRRRDRRRVAVCLVLVAIFLAGNAWAVRDLVVTRDTSARIHNDAQQTLAQLDARQEARDQVSAFRKSAVTMLERETARRNRLAQENEWIRAQTGAKAAAVVAAFRQIESQLGHLVSLSECLSHVQAAMNSVAVGDLAYGATALKEVRRLCGATSQ